MHCRFPHKPNGKKELMLKISTPPMCRLFTVETTFSLTKSASPNCCHSDTWLQNSTSKIGSTVLLHYIWHNFNTLLLILLSWSCHISFSGLLYMTHVWSRWITSGNWWTNPAGKVSNLLVVISLVHLVIAHSTLLPFFGMLTLFWGMHFWFRQFQLLPANMRMADLCVCVSTEGNKRTRVFISRAPFRALMDTAWSYLKLKNTSHSLVFFARIAMCWT